eukprot:401904-Amorphochlora_amoeboformis.AAC.1
MRRVSPSIASAVAVFALLIGCYAFMYTPFKQSPGRVSVAPGRNPLALRGGHNVLRSPASPSSLATSAELKKIKDARGRNYALNFKPRYLSESVQLCKMIYNFMEEESSSVFERFSDRVLCSQFEERRNGD